MPRNRSTPKSRRVSRIRWRGDINLSWRIIYGGRDYDIVSMAEMERRRWLEIMAKAAELSDESA